LIVLVDGAVGAVQSAIDVMLELDFQESVFVLSAEFLQSHVLFEVVDRDPSVFLPRLQRILATKAFSCRVNDLPLATAYFLWLEERQRLAEILDLAPFAEKLYYEFVEVCLSVCLSVFLSVCLSVCIFR
jgi:hypothetical protein